MSITQQPDIPLLPPGLLELSDERDQWHDLILAAYRDGYRVAEGAHAGDYGRGYADGVLDRKHAQHDLVEAATVYSRRWELRGEPRTRKTFGQPHPEDFTGKGAA
jgi:hypothetical protein